MQGQIEGNLELAHAGQLERARFAMNGQWVTARLKD